MTLTTKGRYSLEALLFLASTGKEESGSSVSQATGIPLGYLAQLMMPLTKAGLVSARRGAKGGYKLARAGITAWEVLAVSEGTLKLPCQGCQLKDICSTEEFWARVQASVDQVTSDVTLEELAEKLEAKA